MRFLNAVLQSTAAGVDVLGMQGREPIDRTGRRAAKRMSPAAAARKSPSSVNAIDAQTDVAALVHDLGNLLDGSMRWVGLALKTLELGAKALNFGAQAPVVQVQPGARLEALAERLMSLNQPRVEKEITGEVVDQTT